MRKRTQAREYALQILYQLEMNTTDLAETVASFWRQNPSVPEEVRAFTRLLVEGTQANLASIDAVISRAAENWQIHRMAVIDRNILRFSTYELLFLGDIPPKVSINEAVNIAKKYSQEDSGKFVNGILDKITHTEQKLSPPKNDPPH